MKSLALIAVLVATLAVAACNKAKPAGPNNCQNGDKACDYTDGT